MAKTPALSQFYQVPITTGTGLIAILLFLFLDESSRDLVVIDLRAFQDEPWRLLTTTFVHGGLLRSPQMGQGLIHLGFNLWWIWTLCAALELQWGHLRTLLLIFGFAVFSNCAEYALTGPCVGLSGVVYGFATLLWHLGTHDRKFSGILNSQDVQMLGFWLVLCILLSLTDTMPVANIAHIAGAVAGWLVAQMIIAQNMKRFVYLFGAILLVTATVLGATVARPFINYSIRGPMDRFYLGVEAAQNEDYEKAIEYFESATRYHRVDPSTWYNLGLSYARVGNLAQAKIAVTQAVALQPEQKSFSELLLELDRIDTAPEPTPDSTASPAPKSAPTDLD